MKKIVVPLLFLIVVLPVWAFSPLEEGEKLLMEDRPSEALPYLEQAMDGNPANEKIYLYLGIVYEQLGQVDRAINIMQRGLELEGESREFLFYNIGNNFFRKGENLLAVDMYSKAISTRAGFPEPYLNRANARLKLEEYRGALNDYTVYLRLKPTSEQRYEIERLIGLLKEFLEQQESAAREEEAQEEALMNEVLNLLKNASENSQNLSAGSEGIVEEEIEEIDIED